MLSLSFRNENFQGLSLGQMLDFHRTMVSSPPSRLSSVLNCRVLKHLQK